MKTVLHKIDPANPNSEILSEAAVVIIRGGLVAFPTETVYGLGANALDAAAVLRIFKAKGRPSNNPIIVHAADVEGARRAACEWPERAERLASRFWPGPLTLVLKKQDCVPNEVTAGGPTVAVRVPSNAIALALIRAAGTPIAAPSANRSTEISPTRAEHVLRSLDGRIDMILDGGATTGGIESTVVSLADGVRILRPGLVSAMEIEGVLGEPVPHSNGPQQAQHRAFESPGMMERHYAPRAKLILVSPGQVPEHFHELPIKEMKVEPLFIEGRSSDASYKFVMPPTPKLYAARLYDVLHSLDAKGAELIVVEMPPDTEEWLAVRDRLTRAASPK